MIAGGSAGEPLPIHYYDHHTLPAIRTEERAFKPPVLSPEASARAKARAAQFWAMIEANTVRPGKPLGFLAVARIDQSFEKGPKCPE